MTKVRSADPAPLTTRQHDVLAAIQTYRKRHGRAPLLREIAKGLGLTSYRSLTKHLSVLRERGLLEKSRGWRGLKTLEEAVTLPFLGSIRAGLPQAEDAEALSLRLPHAALQGVAHPERCFILRVSGDSMTPLLEPGDLVLIDPARAPHDGDVVAALVDGQDNTLKTLRRSRRMGRGSRFAREARRAPGAARTGEWILWAENTRYAPLVAQDLRELRLQGVMIKKLTLAG